MKKKTKKQMIVGSVVLIVLIGIGSFLVWGPLFKDKGVLGAQKTSVYCDVPTNVIDNVSNGMYGPGEFMITKKMMAYLLPLVEPRYTPGMNTIFQPGRVGVTDTTIFGDVSHMNVIGLYVLPKSYKGKFVDDWTLLGIPNVKIISYGVPYSCKTLMTNGWSKRWDGNTNNQLVTQYNKRYPDIFYSKALNLYYVCSANDRFIWAFTSRSDALNFDKYNQVCAGDFSWADSFNEDPIVAMGSLTIGQKII